MSKGFYKNRRLKSFIFLSACFLVAFIPHAYNIASFFYLILTHALVIVLYGLIVISRNFKRNNDLNNFLNFDKEKFYGSNHSLFRWNRKISSLEIKEKLIKNKLININDDVLNLNSIERGSSGRVTKLEIQTNKVNKPIILVKDDIRRVLNFIPSNLFTINKLNDDLWLLRGGGFGHGVGLSQSGAIEMAKLGFSYEQILNHYYRDAKLKKIEILSQ